MPNISRCLVSIAIHCCILGGYKKSQHLLLESDGFHINFSLMFFYQQKQQLNETLQKSCLCVSKKDNDREQTFAQIDRKL